MSTMAAMREHLHEAVDFFIPATVKMLVPIELNSKDRLIQGSVDIPEGWTNFSLSFKNNTTGEDLGTYENLEPDGSTEVKIYDSPEDFFSDEEMADAAEGSVPENVEKQKVTFARDPENPRKLQFSTVFDGLGEIEIKLKFGPNQTEGVVTHKLTADATMAELIDYANDRITSIEIPGSEDIPLDLDGDGTPDTGDGSGGLNDIIQAYNAGTMTKPGAPVGESSEDDPSNLVLAINDDNDDEGEEGHQDASDTKISAVDNDIVTLLLKRPANLSENTGTLTLSVSDPDAVRLFSSAGEKPLVDYSVNLASPAGDLSILASSGTAKVYVEGLKASPNVIFTLTYRNAGGEIVLRDTAKLMVVLRASLSSLNLENSFRSAYGNPRKGWMRTYADNGAPIWESLNIVPIGENPMVQYRGLIAKILWQQFRFSTTPYKVAFIKGYVDGILVTLKGDVDSAIGIVNGAGKGAYEVWKFLESSKGEKVARAAMLAIAVCEISETISKIDPKEIPGKLVDLSNNMVVELYSAAERNVPWEPLFPGISVRPDVTAYMWGFAGGMVTESLIVDATGVGIVAKLAPIVKGTIVSARAGFVSLSALSTVAKNGTKVAHMLLPFGRGSKEAAAAISRIGKYLGSVKFSSGKTAAERLAEAFLDKPELRKRCFQYWDEAWRDLPEKSRLARLKLSARRVAELKEIMGSTLSDDALEGFGILQNKLFKAGVDDADRFNDLKGLWKGLDTSGKKQSLNESLATYKTAAQSNAGAKFWMKNIDQVQANAYRYSSFEPSGGWGSFTGNFPSRPEGWFASLDLYDNKDIATDRLLLPLQTSAPRYRFEFSTDSVKSHSRLCRGTQDTLEETFEPLCRDVPEDFVGGGTSFQGSGSQFLVDGQIPVSRVVDLDTGNQVWP